MTRRRLLYKENESVDLTNINPSEAEACDVVFANKETEELTIARKWDANIFPPELYEPIGIVVIPGSHGVLKDGSGTVNQCGVISLVNMDCKTPDIGTTSELTMYWGGYNKDISGKSDNLKRYDSIINGLQNYKKIVYGDKDSNIAIGLGSSGYSYLPRQGSIGGIPTQNNSPYAPSPYAGSDMKSGAYNENYGTTKFDTSSDFNALSDFKGIVNTKIITDLATGQAGWRDPATPIETFTTSNDIVFNSWENGIGNWSIYSGTSFKNYIFRCYADSLGDNDNQIKFIVTGKKGDSIIFNLYDNTLVATSVTAFKIDSDWDSNKVISPTKDSTYHNYYFIYTLPTDGEHFICFNCHVYGDPGLVDPEPNIFDISIYYGNKTIGGPNPIYNSYSYDYYPAACCCARYHTLGTKAFVSCTDEELYNGEKFWYLPACGELGYIIPKLFDINGTISDLKKTYIINANFSTSSKYLSSSENESSRSKTIDTRDGLVSEYNKNYSLVCKAFMRLSAWKEENTPELNDVFVLDQTISDPTKMLTGPLGKDGTPETNIISWIRANSHRYVGTYDSNTGMHLKQLDDTDSTKYADGSDASTDITTKDVFMKMPDFWFRGYELETDKYNLHFTNVEPNDDNNWTKWDSNTLIGVYEAVCEDTGNNTTGGLFSRSNVTPTVNVSQANFKVKARTRSNGDDYFMLVTYEAHQVMALLYMCYYGNMNSREVIGAGTSSYSKVTGATNIDGMSDTISENTRSINFWGLENWWGDLIEALDNVSMGSYSVSNKQSNLRILTYKGSDKKVVRGCSYGAGYIKKMILGESLEVFASEYGNSPTTYYCCSANGGNDSQHVGFRSGSGNGSAIGPFSVLVGSTNGYIADAYGSRLVYNGRVVID